MCSQGAAWGRGQGGTVPVRGGPGSAPHPLGHGGEDVRSQRMTECGVLQNLGILTAAENEKAVQQRWGWGAELAKLGVNAVSPHERAAETERQQHSQGSALRRSGHEVQEMLRMRSVPLTAWWESECVRGV